MGTKGAKLTEKATEKSQWLEASLSTLGNITRKKMFGGYGIFESGVMFALITSKGAVHFKTAESNRALYEKADSEKHGRMPYYSVPNEVIEDKTQLCEWAVLSIKVAHESKSKK